jgi:plastocyanin
MIAASHKNKIGLITLSSVFTVGVLVIFISFTHNATASVTTSSIGVQVGGGSPTNPLFGYTPQDVQIKVGSSVVWYVRPLVPAEPHTVTFVFDNRTMMSGWLPPLPPKEVSFSSQDVLT